MSFALVILVAILVAVTASDGAVEFLDFPDGKFVKVNELTSFYCAVTSGNNKTGLLWKKANATLSHVSRTSIVRSVIPLKNGNFLISSRLRIKHVELHDEGYYYCITTDVTGSSKLAQLVVGDKPKVRFFINGMDNGLLQEKVVRAPLNSSVTLECSDQGFLHWIYRTDMLTYYEDELTVPSRIPDNAHVDPFHSNKIHIEVTEDSAGFYSCQFVEEDDLNILLTPALDKVKIIEWNEIEFNNISYTALFGRYFFTSETEILWYINNSLIDPENSYYKLENDGLNSLLRWAVNQPKSNGWYSLKHELLNLNDSHYVVEEGTPYYSPQNYSGLRYNKGPNSGTGYLIRSYIAQQIKENRHMVIPVVVLLVLGVVSCHILQIVVVLLYKKYHRNKMDQKPGKKPIKISRAHRRVAPMPTPKPVVTAHAINEHVVINME